MFQYGHEATDKIRLDRDAVADLDFLCDTRGDDLQLRAPISRADLEDAADFFNQTGKHNLSPTVRSAEQLTSTTSNRNREVYFQKNKMETRTKIGANTGMANLKA